jgi:hypothetical protein
MIRFNIYTGNGNIFVSNIINGIKSRPVYQPELSTYLFYAKGFLCQIDYNLSNKFIKKEAYIRSLNFLSDFYLNLHLISYEDGIMNFILYRIVKSFFFVKKIGYYYIINNQSITNNISKVLQENLKCIFVYLKLVFEYTKNTKYEKDMVNHLFTSLNKGFNIKRKFSSLIFNNDDYIFYDNIFNMYINCKFIANENKMILQSLKNIINKKNQTYIKH